MKEIVVTGIELRIWLLKLANNLLEERMTTSTGRELARERYEYMKEFFRRLRLEIEGEL